MIGAAGVNPKVDAGSYSGLTDFEIMSALTGLEPHQVAKEVEQYLECLSMVLEDGAVRPLRNAETALTSLTAMGAPTFIVTGNEPRGAAIKISAAGLNQTVLDTKVYGSSRDRSNRIEIARLAMLHEGQTRGVFVGDSPNDVEAAHHFNWPCIGVPTGFHDVISLQRAGADVVLGDSFTSQDLVSAVLTLSAK